jgi:hypothetical protein
MRNTLLTIPKVLVIGAMRWFHLFPRCIASRVASKMKNASMTGGEWIPAHGIEAWGF